MLIYFIFPKLGIHREVLKKAELDSTKWKPETYFEAYTHIHSFNYAEGDKEEDKKFEEVKFIQDWVRKRMDILTINFTLFWATVVSPLISVFGLRFFLKWESLCKNYCLILIISFFAILFCFITYMMMRKSVIIVLVDYFNSVKENSPSQS